MKRHVMLETADTSLCGKPLDWKKQKKGRRWWQFGSCRNCLHKIVEGYNSVAEENDKRGARLAAIERELYR